MSRTGGWTAQWGVRAAAPEGTRPAIRASPCRDGILGAALPTRCEVPRPWRPPPPARRPRASAGAGKLRRRRGRLPLSAPLYQRPGWFLRGLFNHVLRTTSPLGGAVVLASSPLPVRPSSLANCRACRIEIGSSPAPGVMPAACSMVGSSSRAAGARGGLLSLGAQYWGVGRRPGDHDGARYRL
jgi:hypothetical protein